MQTDKETFFQDFFMKDNFYKVDGLYQDIIYMSYNLLSKSSADKSHDTPFEKKVLNLMQNNGDKLLKNVFIDTSITMYKDNYTNHCCRVIILNVLKHCFVKHV